MRCKPSGGRRGPPFAYASFANGSGSRRSHRNGGKVRPTLCWRERDSKPRSL
jgi:hypothetical protein